MKSVGGFKVCSGCKEKKTVAAFSVRKAAPDGLNPYCKPCHKVRLKADPNRLARKRKWYRQWYIKNRSRLLREQKKRDKNRYKRLGRRVYNPFKERARVLLSLAVLRGEIKRPRKCSECGWIGKVDGHHKDYGKPFEVEWLCRICHGKRHRMSTNFVEPVLLLVSRKCLHCRRTFRTQIKHGKGAKLCSEVCRQEHNKLRCKTWKKKSKRRKQNGGRQQ